MTIVFDRALAVVGRLSASLHGRAAWVPWAVVGVLLIVSLIPALIVGSTKQPTDISFADLRAQLIPAATSWFRLRGDLRAVSQDGRYIYTFHDPLDGARAVTVISDAPHATGRTEVTGRIGSQNPLPGTFQSIQADVPTEPARHDPWLLFSLPAILAIVLLFGSRVGYPVVRGDAAIGSAALPLRSDESVAARWSGRIGNEWAPPERMRSCSIAIEKDAGVCRLTIDEAGTVRAVSVRRAATRKRMRMCWTSGCRPAVEVHGPSADLVLTFDDPGERDRLLASLA